MRSSGSGAASRSGNAVAYGSLGRWPADICLCESSRPDPLGECQGCAHPNVWLTFSMAHLHVALRKYPYLAGQRIPRSYLERLDVERVEAAQAVADRLLDGGAVPAVA